MEGEMLDIPQILHTDSGQTTSRNFIAHLGDAERMFFVSPFESGARLMRTQSEPRACAILYMDEIFGYFPPVANPPSKLPLLTC
jgi:hypothetical protein